MVLLPFLTGCSKDEDSELNLSQTIWEGCIAVYDASEEYSENAVILVLEFTSETEGKCILPKFSQIQGIRYVVADSIISFDGCIAISGDWYIIGCSKEQIILQAYLPYKQVMTLKRVH